MPGIMLLTNGHRLDVQLNTVFTAMEIVRYDGEEKSKKSSWFGTTHTFDVTENGESARYEVITRMSWHGAECTITRNGVLIFTHT